MACSESISEPLFVAAIDFGTTFSGYAFATLSDFKDDPLKIHAFTWTTGSNAGLSNKTPTCILFDPDQKFHSFGSDAENKYTELAQEDLHTQWYYFRRFKMQLYLDQGIHRDIKLKDDQGKQMPAMKVIGESIRFIKDHMIEEMKKKDLVPYIKLSDINWVLTVPAIWSDAAKQFMRESAVQGGIPNTQLMLALEPEAASIYCKHIPSEKMVDNEGTVTLDAFSAGTKYLIFDAGGGTIDITVQQVQNDGSIKQLYVANGGAWGGTKVDEAFEEFLQELVGKPVIDRFHAMDKAGHLDLLREFEIKKRHITPDQTSKVTFRVPLSLREAYKAVSGKDLSESALKSKSIVWKSDKLRVDPHTAHEFFTSICDHITEHLRKVLDDPKVKGTETILMVGGFSESPILRSAIEKAFPKKKIIVPNEAGLAVLKGAVQFGFKPRIISSRICKLTYGVEITIAFEEGIDPENKKIIREGSVLCSNRFDKHVEIQQAVGIDEKLGEQIYTPCLSDQTSMVIPIWSSQKKDPRYTFEPGCVRHGKLTVPMPDTTGGKNREVGVSFIFGKQEIEVTAEIKATGEEFGEIVPDWLNP